MFLSFFSVFVLCDYCCLVLLLVSAFVGHKSRTYLLTSPLQNVVTPGRALTPPKDGTRFRFQSVLLFQICTYSFYSYGCKICPQQNIADCSRGPIYKISYEILRSSQCQMMPNSQSTYDGHLIYKTPDKGCKALLRYDSFTKS